MAYGKEKYELETKDTAWVGTAVGASPGAVPVQTALQRRGQQLYS
jgi:hypothetical protein